MPETRKERILTTARIPDAELRYSILLTSGLAKNISRQDARAWCEEGHIYDTPGGRQFLRRLHKIGIFTSRYGGPFPPSRKAARFKD